MPGLEAQQLDAPCATSLIDSCVWGNMLHSHAWVNPNAEAINVYTSMAAHSQFSGIAIYSAPAAPQA